MLNTQKRDNKGYLKMYYKNLSSSIIGTIYRLDRGIIPGHIFFPKDDIFKYEYFTVYIRI